MQFVLFTVNWKLCRSEKIESTRQHFREIIHNDMDYQDGIDRIDQLDSPFGDETLSFATVKHLDNEFNRGRRLFVDKSRKGFPKSTDVWLRNDDMIIFLKS